MSDETEIQLAQSGDHDAFIRLIHNSETTLYRTGKAFLPSDDDVADAIQETILKAYRSLNGLREPRYFKTWLIRILINECKRMLKQKQTLIPMQEYVPVQTPTHLHSD